MKHFPLDDRKTVNNYDNFLLFQTPTYNISCTPCSTKKDIIFKKRDDGNFIYQVWKGSNILFIWSEEDGLTSFMNKHVCLPFRVKQMLNSMELAHEMYISASFDGIFDNAMNYLDIQNFGFEWELV